VEPLPWLFRVARGCLANELRTDRRRARIAEKIAGRGVEPAPDHALSVITDAGLRQAMTRLSDDDRLGVPAADPQTVTCANRSFR